jgi:8-oxo-dGTP pyrophosphatase MutT (NUDIX family)
MTDETLYQNEWVSLKKITAPEKGINGYVYSHETRCQGRIVAILPFKTGGKKFEILLKSEVTPCWNTDIPILSTITGGYEGGDIRDDAVRELLEETGYQVSKSELITLGTSFASKSSDTIYELFSVDLTGKEKSEALGDGSRLEKESVSVWNHPDRIFECKDPQASVMLIRFLNIIQKGII